MWRRFPPSVILPVMLENLSLKDAAMSGDYDPWLNSPPPKHVIAHELGQNLDSLSIFELDERIKALNLEITRLEAAKSAKEASAKAAVAFFQNVTGLCWTRTNGKRL